MAKYFITASAYVAGEFYQADIRNPQTIVVPDGTPPSRTWEPLDEAAKADMEALVGHEVEVADEAALRSEPKIDPNAHAKVGVKKPGKKSIIPPGR